MHKKKTNPNYEMIHLILYNRRALRYNPGKCVKKNAGNKNGSQKAETRLQISI